MEGTQQELERLRQRIAELEHQLHGMQFEANGSGGLQAIGPFDATATNPDSSHSLTQSSDPEVLHAILRLLAEGKAAVAVLEALCSAASQDAPGVACAVLVFRLQSGKLFPVANSGLPTWYSDAIRDGFTTEGASAGSSGKAVHCRKTIEVTANSTTALWQRELMQRGHFAVCCSRPIFSADEPLGVLDTYFQSEEAFRCGKEIPDPSWLDMASIALQRLLDEAAIRAGEQRFSTMFHLAAVGMSMVSLPDGRFIAVNQKLAEITGYRVEELIGRNFLDITHPEDRAGNESAFQALLSGRISYYAYEKRYIRKSGEPVWVQTTISLVRDSAGAPLHSVGVIEDISARKQAEEVLQQSRHRLSLALDAGGHTVWDWNFAGDELDTTSSATRELVSLSRYLRAVHEDDRALVEGAVRDALDNSHSFECEFRTIEPDGSAHWVLRKGVVLRDSLGQPVRMVGVSTDVTARKKAELDARNARRQLEDILSSIRESFIAVDPEWRITYASERVAGKAGVPREQLIGRNLWEITPPEKESLLRHHLNIVMRDRIPQRFEIRYPAPLPDCYEVYAHPTEDGLSALILDITDRNKVELALRQSEQKQRLITDSLPVLIAYVDNEGRYQFNNRTYERWFGVRADQMVGRYMRDAVGEEAFRHIETYVRAALLGEPQFFESFIKRGEPRHVRVSYIPDMDENSFVRGFFLMIEDMSEQKRMEITLRASEERYRFLSESIPQFVWTTDEAGRINYVNQHWVNYTGLTLADAHAGRWREIVHPDDVEKLRQAIRTPSEGTDFEVEFRLRRAEDGAYRWCLARGHFVALGEGETRGIGTAIDIDDRKRAEDALRATNETLAAFLQACPLAVLVLDPDGTVRLWNAASERLFGWAADEVAGKFIPAVGEEMRLLILKNMAASLQGEPVMGFEATLLKKDGPFIAEIWSAALKTGDGRRQCLAVIADITDRRRAEIALRDSEVRFRELANALPAIVWVTSAEGRCTYFNDLWQSVTGLTREQSVGTGWVRALHPDDHEPVLQAWSEAVKSGTPYEGECRYQNASGDYRWFLARALPVRDSSGEIGQWFGTSTDIHESKRSEADLRRANADLEQFAYSASHDLREPLRMVSIYSELLQRRYRGRLDEQADQYLQFAITGAKRMEALIADLLAYTQVVNMTDEDVPLVSAEVILDQVLSNLQNAISESGATIERQPLPTIRIHAAHLLLILQNLVGNAIKYRGEQKPIIRISSVPAGHLCQFCVSDNGIGIASPYTDQVFRLFKRLHSPDKYSGTGIGLSICQKIVERYGGSIWLESEGDGEGCSFYFTLPCNTPSS